MTANERKRARKLSTLDICNRFPESKHHKATIDPFCKVRAAAGGGPTGRSDDNFGAKQVRAAYDKVKAK